MDNKPLLFIETVQTTINEDVGQSIYDSRRDKKNDIPDKIVEMEEIPDIPQVEQEKSSKLRQKVNLLDKRAKQEHFVYVEINLTEGEHYRGFFKGLTNNRVLLSEEEEVREIDLANILEITILKV
jgi:hypothetical protein